jgi:hypothetical protein
LGDELGRPRERLFRPKPAIERDQPGLAVEIARKVEEERLEERRACPEGRP